MDCWLTVATLCDAADRGPPTPSGWLAHARAALLAGGRWLGLEGPEVCPGLAHAQSSSLRGSAPHPTSAPGFCLGVHPTPTGMDMDCSQSNSAVEIPPGGDGLLGGLAEKFSQ